jgi:dTDP-4-dehydrorhamnose reductase
MDDVVVSPTYVPDLVNATLDLLIDGEQGLWHLVNEGSVSWAEFARQAAVMARINPAGLVARAHGNAGLLAPRPSFSALTSERGVIMPTLEDALVRYVAGR